MAPKAKKSPDHDALYRIAEQQAGYYTARQACDAGFSWERLSEHARSGRFLRVVQGIYRLAHFPSSPFEDLFVAWLRCGPRSVISHERALAVYDLSDVIPAVVHITVPRSASRRRPGIRQHTTHLASRDVVNRAGLRVTSVPRTIADVIRAGLSEDQARRAIEEALRSGLVERRALRAYARRAKGRAARLILKYSGEPQRQS